jgi:hypothetical protein
MVAQLLDSVLLLFAHWKSCDIDIICIVPRNPAMVSLGSEQCASVDPPREVALLEHLNLARKHPDEQRA